MKLRKILSWLLLVAALSAMPGCSIFDCGGEDPYSPPREDSSDR